MKMVTTLINGKFKIKLTEHRAKRTEWTSKEGWEKKRLESMHKHIGKGDVVYYVGAELGEMPALCQMWGAEVMLFEPNHSAWPVIKAVWKANKLKRPLGLFAGFASDEDKPIPLKPNKELYDGIGWSFDKDTWPYFSQGKILKTHGFSELYKEANGLPQHTIDKITKEGITNIKTKKIINVPPTAIILDVEGSEWKVLEGAEETIKELKPKIWLSGHPEFMFHQYGKYLTDLRNWIKAFGYKETLLDYQHEVHLFYEKS